jgi:signal transduction histidine kinase
MSESYSDVDASGAAGRRATADSTAGGALARELLVRLLPTANVELLVTALLAEQGAPPADPRRETPFDADQDPPAKELRRVRTQLALGESARMVQHAMNNPLTALLAEAQLLELEPLAEEHRLAVVRMVELARRVVTVTRRFDTVTSPRIG